MHNQGTHTTASFFSSPFDLDPNASLQLQDHCARSLAEFPNLSTLSPGDVFARIIIKVSAELQTPGGDGPQETMVKFFKSTRLT